MMKRFFCVIMVLIMLVGCSPIEKGENKSATNTKNVYVTGVWITYSELDGMLANGDFKNQFDEVLSNCKAHSITDVFVHTRAFCDAVYPSSYFPLRDSVKEYDFDVLEYMITKCHENKIKFHAWINPYRVRTADSETSNLPSDSFVLDWLTDENTTNVCIFDGIYLNPASSEARQIIINGIREIVIDYAVDGIHFDDYFYPTQDELFAQKSYSDYCSNTQKPLAIDEWRRANVNSLISGCFTAIKFTDADIIFSVSPSASIDENYNRHYADIPLWIESGCVDCIIPQLYFGFDYPEDDYKFDNLIDTWQKVTKNSETKLLIGLAPYKIHTETEPDNIEWKNGVNIIKRQTDICKKSSYISGHIYFSYSAMCEYL